MRIYFDTNVLVSAYVARGICADLLRYVLTEHELVTGEVNLVELRRILRDRFKATPERIDAVEAELRAETIIPRPSKPSVLAIRDPDDAWVLASAIDGAVDLFVTGDDDLLAVAAEAPLPIVNPRGCWQRLRE